jgi:hypothetical protein
MLPATIPSGRLTLAERTPSALSEDPMTFSRPVLIRTASAIILSMAVAACSSAGATSAAGGTPGATTATSAPIVTVAPTAPGTTVAATQAATVATPAAAGGVPDCSGGQIGRKAYRLPGIDAQLYCGPATASMTAGGTTVQVSGGWCETNAAGYTVSIGTQLFGNPDASLEPDLLVVLVDPGTGIGTVSGVVNHHHWLIVGGTIVFAADKKSGTWTGPNVSGGTASGSFTCGA